MKDKSLVGTRSSNRIRNQNTNQSQDHTRSAGKSKSPTVAKNETKMDSSNNDVKKSKNQTASNDDSKKDSLRKLANGESGLSKSQTVRNDDGKMDTLTKNASNIASKSKSHIAGANDSKMDTLIKNTSGGVSKSKSQTASNVGSKMDTLTKNTSGGASKSKSQIAVTNDDSKIDSPEPQSIHQVSDDVIKDCNKDGSHTALSHCNNNIVSNDDNKYESHVVSKSDDLNNSDSISICNQTESGYINYNMSHDDSNNKADNIHDSSKYDVLDGNLNANYNCSAYGGCDVSSSDICGSHNDNNRMKIFVTQNETTGDEWPDSEDILCVPSYESLHKCAREKVLKQMEHRISCHRCGNNRKNVRKCALCPQVICEKCIIKWESLEEESWNRFQPGCPVCLKLCCCYNKITNCKRPLHCYKKCPSTRGEKRSRRNSSVAEENEKDVNRSYRQNINVTIDEVKSSEKASEEDKLHLNDTQGKVMTERGPFFFQPSFHGFNEISKINQLFQNHCIKQIKIVPDIVFPVSVNNNSATEVLPSFNEIKGSIDIDGLILCNPFSDMNDLSPRNTDEILNMEAISDTIFLNSLMVPQSLENEKVNVPRVRSISALSILSNNGSNDEISLYDENCMMDENDLENEEGFIQSIEFLSAEDAKCLQESPIAHCNSPGILHQNCDNFVLSNTCIQNSSLVV